MISVTLHPPRATTFAFAGRACGHTAAVENVNAPHRRAADIVADPSARLRHRIEGSPLADEPMATEVAQAASTAAMAGQWAGAGELWFAVARLTADVTARDRYLTDAVAIGIYGGQAEAAAKALAASAPMQDPARSAFVTGALALVRGELLWFGEHTREALGELRTAAAVLRGGQPASTIGLCALLHLGWVEYQLGHWDDAIAHSALAASIAADSEQLWIAEKLAALAVWPLAARGAAETSTYLRQAEGVFSELTVGFPDMLALARARVAHAAADAAGVVTALLPFAELPSDDPLEPVPVQWRPMYAEALAQLREPAMRIILNLRRADDGRVDGEVQLDGDGAARVFSGWIELLDLLDRAASPPPPPIPTG